MRKYIFLLQRHALLLLQTSTSALRMHTTATTTPPAMTRLAASPALATKDTPGMEPHAPVRNSVRGVREGDLVATIILEYLADLCSKASWFQYQKSKG